MNAQTIAVVIGRNEGNRLRRCITSLAGRTARTIYVDSGSTDGSVELAHALGAAVVELDPETPFTAARARNAGLSAGDRALHPPPTFVQFVDGDCEVAPGWIECATATLEQSPDVAIVCGRRRERAPEASVYNRLCDLEWDTPTGQSLSSGGDALVRTAAFREVGGFDPSLIAGEEPELCLRLRRRGWHIVRIDAEMTIHDAAMTRFGQWWKRTVRAGHAFAEGSAMHGRGPERHWVRESRRAWLWGFVIPAAALLFAIPTRGASLLLLAGHALLFWRVARARRRRGDTARTARLYALFCVAGKVPEALGQLLYWWRRSRHRRSRLLEYKARAQTARRPLRRSPETGSPLTPPSERSAARADSHP